MSFCFYKLESAGNDYIYVDCLAGERRLSRGAVVAMCGRHTGIGADGVIFIRPSAVADCFMDIYNSDGSRALMCGNGIRCVGALCRALGCGGESQRIETLSGIFEVSVEGDPHSCSASVRLIPRFDGEPRAVVFEGSEFRAAPVDVGNPHTVIETTDIASLDLERVGSWAERCLGGSRNVEFVEPAVDGRLRVRVWERGSGETYSCGTGAVAAAFAHSALSRGDKSAGNDVYEVEYRGGRLSVELGRDFAVLSGVCRFLFEGETEEALWE